MEELIVVIVAAGTAGGLLCARHGAKTAVLAPSVLPVTREERHELHFWLREWRCRSSHIDLSKVTPFGGEEGIGTQV